MTARFETSRPDRPKRPSTEQTPKSRSDVRSIMMTLQRQAGNAAVARLLVGGRQPTLVVQRHESWEHTLLGNATPEKLVDQETQRITQDHVLREERDRILYFQRDAGRDPQGKFPDVRWLQLKTSQLWISYGELNGLADYFPNPEAIDGALRSTVLPVLQRMRENSLRIITRLRRPRFAETLGGSDEPTSIEMSAAAQHPMRMVHEEGGNVLALDQATARLGTDRYKAVLARNACHFAPFSWNRFSLFHEQAQSEARQFFASARELVTVADVSADENVHLRNAILNNGYADHFLQDSFAAGHLMNKTLVMQWFAEYLNSLGAVARPWFGSPGAELLGAMSEQNQTGLAARHLYAGPNLGGASSTSTIHSTDDRRGYTSNSVDPQTAEERERREDRVRGSGVIAANGHTEDEAYQLYLQFLNSSLLQKAAGNLHDWLNENGLVVENEREDVMHIGGDSTLLSRSGPVGLQVAAEAAQLSRTAIQQLLDTGDTDIDVTKILRLVPKKVYVDTSEGMTEAISLESFQDAALRSLCWSTIFPDLVGNDPRSEPGWTGRLLRSPLTDYMTDRGVSQDGFLFADVIRRAMDQVSREHQP